MRLMPRFSLRTVAVLVTLLCLLLAFLADWYHRAVNQRRAVAAIEAAGGWVKIEEKDDHPWLRERLGRHYFDRVTFASVPSEFPWIQRLPRLREVELTGKFADADMVNLLDNHHLQRVAIRGPQVSGKGLEILCRIESLRSIEITGSKLTAKDLVHFQLLPQLQRLSLAYTELDDSDLQALGSLPLLEELRLQGCPIEGKGFAHVANALPRLKKLDLSSTLLSRAGLRAVTSNLSLEELDLSRTAVDDEYLTGLGPATSLSAVDLSHTKITDAALPHIFALPELKALDVSSTRVTLPSVSSEGKGTQLSRLGVDYRQLASEAAVDDFFETQPMVRLLVPGQRREFDIDAWNQVGNLSRRSVLRLLRLHQEQQALANRLDSRLRDLNAQE